MVDLDRDELLAALAEHRQWFLDGVGKPLNLSHRDLGGIDLSGADLSGVKLDGTDLRCAMLAGCQLYAAQMLGTRLDGAQLRRADLTEASALAIQGRGLDMTDGALFDASRVADAVLDGVDATGASGTVVDVTVMIDGAVVPAATALVSCGTNVNTYVPLPS